MADTAATTRPSRTRRNAKAAEAETTPTKATPAKAAKAATPKAAAVTTGEDGRTRVPVVLEYVGDTKSYAVFTPPKSSGCVGKFYAPLGTEEVKVLLIGPAE
jgi:hypothetical protein